MCQMYKVECKWFEEKLNLRDYPRYQTLGVSLDSQFILNIK